MIIYLGTDEVFFFFARKYTQYSDVFAYNM